MMPNPAAKTLDILTGKSKGFTAHLSPFEEVPARPGVYAWFYPLHIRDNMPLKECMEELRKIHLYLSRRETSEETEPPDTKGLPKIKNQVKMGWHEVEWSFEIKNKELNIASTSWNKLEHTWNTIQADGSEWKNFKRAIMGATFWMPPLYIGKTENLNMRCSQHVKGVGRGGFRGRFEEYAKSHQLNNSLVSHLIFATIETDELNLGDSNRSLDLVEEILKNVGRPPYGIE